MRVDKAVTAGTITLDGEVPPWYRRNRTKISPDVSVRSTVAATFCSLEPLSVVHVKQRTFWRRGRAIETVKSDVCFLVLPYAEVSR